MGPIGANWPRFRVRCENGWLPHPERPDEDMVPCPGCPECCPCPECGE